MRLDASDVDLLEDHSFEKVHVTPSDPSFNDIDQNYCKQIDYYGYRFPLNGHLRDAFINDALDCDLALDIWKTITLEKTSLGMRDDLSLTVIPLKSMTVEVLGAGRFYWAHTTDTLGFHDLLKIMGRKIHLKRFIGKDGNAQIEANRNHHDPWPSKMELWVEEIYRRLWPKKSENWWEDWDSFPLAASAEDEIDWK